MCKLIIEMFYPNHSLAYLRFLVKTGKKGRAHQRAEVIYSHYNNHPFERAGKQDV